MVCVQSVSIMFLGFVALGVSASGLFHHGSSHGWDHADAKKHGHDDGFKKGDESDWARVDYGGHKAHASGDAYATGYAHEHGDDHGHKDGWDGGHDAGHGSHSSHHSHHHPEWHTHHGHEHHPYNNPWW